MGIKGRKRRLRAFEEKAKAFANDLETGRGYDTIDRDDRIAVIGVGKNKRLVKKNCALEAKEAIEVSQTLVDYLKNHKIVPNNYQLVMPVLDPKTGVQEYFSRPSLELLLRYRSGHFMEKENAQLCRKLFGDFPGIYWGEIRKAGTELLEHLKKVGHQPDISNIIVVGQTRDGKLRLALVDV